MEVMEVVEGSVVRGGYSAEDLAPARVVKVDLVVLPEGGKVSSSIGDVKVDSRGGHHDGVWRTK